MINALNSIINRSQSNIDDYEGKFVF